MAQNNSTIKTAFKEALPLAIAIATYGLSYGVLATQADLSLIQIVSMSLFVFSGSVQLVTVAMIASKATFISIVVTVFLLNLRNILYGIALAENFLLLKRKWRWVLSFGINDESFVLGSARFSRHGNDPLYFGVVAIIFYLSWFLSSLLGALIGHQIDPLKWGLDLAFPVTFVALLIPSLKGKPIIATCLAALLIVVFLEYTMPGNEFTIVITGVLAPFIGLYVSRREAIN